MSGSPPGPWDDYAPVLAPMGFPGTLYDGTGVRLEGEGPENVTADELHQLPLRITLTGREAASRVKELGPDDRIWLLPDSLGTPPEMPMPILWDLAGRLAMGRAVALVGNNQALGLAVRDALAVLHAEPQGHA